MAREGVLLFGAGKIAEIVFDVLCLGEDFEVAGLLVDDHLLEQANAESPLGRSVQIFPLSALARGKVRARFGFAAVGYQAMNSLRMSRLRQLEDSGLSIIRVLHPAVSVARSAVIDRGCFVDAMASIQSGSRVCAGTFIFGGAVIGHHSKVEEGCWIASGAVLGGSSVVGTCSFIGLSATVSHSVTIGSGSFVGASALCADSVEPETVIVGPSSSVALVSPNLVLRTLDAAELKAPIPRSNQNSSQTTTNSFPP